MKRNLHRLFTALTAVTLISGGMAGLCPSAFAAPAKPPASKTNPNEKVPGYDITWVAYNKLSDQAKSDYMFSYQQSQNNPSFSIDKWNQMSAEERTGYRRSVAMQASFKGKLNASHWDKMEAVPQAVLDYLIKEHVYDTSAQGMTPTHGSYTEWPGFSGAFSRVDARHPDVMPPSDEVRAWLDDNLSEATGGHGGPETYTGAMVRDYVLNYQRATVTAEFLDDWSVARTGSDAALLAQLEAHPGSYANILRDIGTRDITKIRKYIKEQLVIAEGDFDDAAMNATVFQAQQKQKKNSPLMAGTTLVDSGNANTRLKKFGDEFAELQAKVAQAEALLRARIAARQPLDLTNGDLYTVLAFENIYPIGYDASASGRVTATGDLYGRTPSSAGNSLSAGGMSLSSIGWSLSAAGSSLSSAGSAGLPGQGDPYFRVSAGDTRTMYSSYAARALAETNPDLAMLMYGPLWSMGNESPYAGLYNDVPNRSLYLTRYDHDGTLSALTDPGTLAGFMDKENATRLIAAGDVQGLGRLLAQPFNVLVTWGSQLYDLDLHMTGPGVDDPANRFHIYFSARGDQLSAPFAELIKDCVCYSGSEVILTTQLQKGGVYRISAFNFGNQSSSSTELSSAGDVVLQIVRGGQAVSQGSGTTIVGGKTIFTGSPKSGQAGNTWTAVEIDPRNGGIYFVDKVTSTSGSQNVQ